MSYGKDNMVLVGGVPGNAVYSYKSEDGLAEIMQDGYFDAAVKQYNLDSGDQVHVSAGKNGCTEGGTLICALNDEGGVATFLGGLSSKSEKSAKAPKK
ncbi:MAG: hypothetical protein ACNI27_03750 [Desulfovibrio sp.]